MIINLLLVLLIPFMSLTIFTIPINWIFVAGIVEGLLVARFLFDFAKHLKSWLM